MTAKISDSPGSLTLSKSGLPTAAQTEPAEATLRISRNARRLTLSPVQRYISGQQTRWGKFPLQMDIFLSYASEDRPRAEEVALALRNDGHEVFFDRTQLEGGENYHQVIRDRLATTDLLIFLITPKSVEAGGYALSELRHAQERWPSPRNRVVPVLLEATPMESVPTYLKAVTVFEVKGNVAAEVTAYVHRFSQQRRRRRWVVVAGLLSALLIVGAMGMYVTRDSTTEPPFHSSIQESDFVSYFVMDGVVRDEYRLDPTARFPTDRGDVVQLERLAFGELPNGRKAFSLRVSVTNYSDDPIQLDLTPRFFALIDDQGQRAELLFFCCEARGDLLPPQQQRVVHLIYAAVPGWEGKETTPGMIHFRIAGLLPVVRASWSFRPLATAA